MQGVHLGYVASPRALLYSFSRRHLRRVLPRPVGRERPVSRLHGLGTVWYSAQDSLAILLIGRRLGMMHIVCYLRQESNVFALFPLFGVCFGCRHARERTGGPPYAGVSRSGRRLLRAPRRVIYHVPFGVGLARHVAGPLFRLHRYQSRLCDQAAVDVLADISRPMSSSRASRILWCSDH
jgi:hypothetical protein